MGGRVLLDERIEIKLRMISKSLSLFYIFNSSCSLSYKIPNNSVPFSCNQAFIAHQAVNDFIIPTLGNFVLSLPYTYVYNPPSGRRVPKNKPTEALVTTQQFNSRALSLCLFSGHPLPPTLDATRADPTHRNRGDLPTAISSRPSE